MTHSTFRLLAGSTIYNGSMLSDSVLNHSEETDSTTEAIYRSVHRNNTTYDNAAEVTDRIMAMCRDVKARSHNGAPPQLTGRTSHKGTPTQLTETTSHNGAPPQLTGRTSHNGAPPQLTETTSHNGMPPQLTGRTSQNGAPPQLTETTSQNNRETAGGLVSQRNKADLQTSHKAVAIQLSDTSTHKHNTVNIMNDVTTQSIRKIKGTSKRETLKYDTVEILPGNIDADYDYAVDVESETGIASMLAWKFQNENTQTTT